MVDTEANVFDRHTVSFGGNFIFVDTTESLPLFYPFEADFPSLGAFLGNDGPAGGVGAQCVSAASDPGGPGPAGCQHPNVIFFERFQAPNFNEQSLNTSVYSGTSFTPAIRDAAEGTMNHTYNGLYIQDKWRATSRLTLNAGVRWGWETWPPNVLNTQWQNVNLPTGV